MSLTAAGRALVRRAPEPPTARLFTALEQLDDREQRALASGGGSPRTYLARRRWRAAGRPRSLVVQHVSDNHVRAVIAGDRVGSAETESRIAAVMGVERSAVFGDERMHHG